METVLALAGGLARAVAGALTWLWALGPHPDAARPASALPAGRARRAHAAAWRAGRALAVASVLAVALGLLALRRLLPS
ncbi:hypothetical protein [Kineococcus terrestris]|uniref:hypothetical protein n=1 Tax=Kineococcus terrestris TaxID=2044856 RepID=UPI0034DAF0B0